jgi:hypothetical protein
MKKQRTRFIIIALLFCILVYGAYYIWKKYQWANDLIESSAPKYSRLTGLIDSKDKLELLEKSSQAELDKLAYPVWKTADEVASSVEQALREIIKGSQMDLVSIQTFPPQEFHGLDQFVFDVKIEGDIVSLHELLNLVKVQTPFFWIEQISFQTSGASRPNTKQRIFCQMKIFVLRSR